jgi:hypothetical protein
MRKLVLVLSLLAMATPAMADPYDHRRIPQPHRRPYEHRGHGAAPWIAGAIGLGVLGAIIANQPPRPTCWNEMVGYDRFGREVWQRVCS